MKAHGDPEGTWSSSYLIEGKTGAKITLKPLQKGESANISLGKTESSDSSKNAPEPVPNKLNSTPMEPVQTDAKSSEPIIAAYFSPSGGVEKQILSIIGGAAQSIEMAAYSFTNQNIAKSLVEAINRGVTVSLVLDRSATKGLQATIHDELEKAGTAIRLSSPIGGIMHDKFIIVDGKSLEWGSYDYTDRAENVNYANATFLTDSKLALQYHSDFESIYKSRDTRTAGSRTPTTTVPEATLITPERMS